MKDDITITQKEINAFDIIFSEYILPALLSINFKETTWEEFKLGIQDILFG